MNALKSAMREDVRIVKSSSLNIADAEQLKGKFNAGKQTQINITLNVKQFVRRKEAVAFIPVMWFVVLTRIHQFPPIMLAN